MKSLDKLKVVEELPSTAVESENVQLLHGALVHQEADEAKATDSVEHRHIQKTEEQKPGNTSEGIHSQAVEVKSASPDFSSTSRRKMGSTCMNLGSRSKRENMDQEAELEIDATKSETTGELTSESVSEIKEEKLQVQPQSRKSDSDQRKVFQTVASSQVGEALLKPLVEETPEESPGSQSQNDHVLEPAPGGRRKKFGSNRKPRLQQTNKDQNESEDGLTNAQNENDAGETTEEDAAEQQTDKSPDLDKITEVDEDGEKASAISISVTKEFAKPLSEATPRKLYPDENRWGQESERQLSFGTDRSNGYNVVLVGESCVGKSSFLKRAQSGKFALDIPASVGLDSCKWTVVVDGKPVVLHLWDTAGQERFHSITRHIFHKAQAFILMYDITSSQSFSAVSYWANSIQESAADNVTVLLLGNKSDHAEKQVKTEQGDILAKEYNFGFMECSAATGENVIEALETVARMLSQSSDLREEATVLHQQQRSQSKCC
ncbi:ras and EF-hand domain-containing protein [Nematolebias whitei]|uniref:ras and EF-hand domain-containing protein n=1 Tax=Nematolebias whitei TaxID=451745 RepID=UPI001899601A|nr:ras and EF-hand domain-containing protein [Nematolebias whitei]